MGLGLSEAGELPDGFAGALGFEVPQGAIERVAGGAGLNEVWARLRG